jgi:hypothetical protein
VATLGNTVQGATRAILNSDAKYANQFVLSESGILTSIVGFIDGQTGGGPGGTDVRCGIYAASPDGSPGALIVQSAVTRIPYNGVAQWYVFDCSGTQTILAPGTYWITAHIGPQSSGLDPNVRWYMATTGGTFTQQGGDAFADGLSNPFGGAAVSANSNLFSMYANYTPFAQVGKSLALPWVTRAAAGRSVAFPFSLIPVVGRSLSLAYTIKSATGRSVALPWQTIARLGRSLSALWGVAQGVVGRSVEFRYGVGAPAAIPGRVNADTYLDGASNPFGIASITTTDMSIYGSYYFPWRPRMPEPEIELARLPYEIAQAILGETGARPSTRQRVVLGWHGTALDPERGSVAIVPPGGKLAALVGKRVRFTYRGGTAPRFVVAYVSAAVLGIPDDEDISVSRRTFLALSPLTIDALNVEMEEVPSP